MKKTLLFALGNFLLVIANAQSVGIGTTTPFKYSSLHVKGTDSTYSILVDGDSLGTGLQVVRGNVGIGPFTGFGRLFVSTEPGTKATIDSVPPIVGVASTAPSALGGGIYGTYDPSFLGVGIQGIGADGIEYANLFSGQRAAHIGVYGSAFHVGVAGFGYGYGMRAIGGYAGIFAQVEDFNEEAMEEQFGIYATAQFASAPVTFAGYFDGNVHVAGELSKASGTFKIDDPIDPENKYLYHSFVESPDMMNIYNGNVTTDVNGIAEVVMPAYFDALNKDFRYQLTSIGTFAQAIVKTELDGNHFTVQTSQPNVKVSWQVTGVRKDKFAEAHRVKVEVEKEPWNKGLYLHAKEFGKDKAKSIAYQTGVKLSSHNALKNAPVLSEELKTRLHQPTLLNKTPLLRFNLNSN